MYSSIFVASLATLTLAVGPQIDGYTRSDPGTSAISVPVKGGCSTFISHSVYEGTTLDAARCTAECDDSCDDCRFVNTWMELKDGQPTRQICALYTTSYTDADATSKSYTRPSDNAVVTVGSSACYSKTDAPSSVDSKCVVDGPVPYPPVVKSCPSKNRQGSGSASSSSNGGSGSASSGSSNGGSSSASSGSSNGGSDSASGSSNDGSGSASGPSNGGSGSVSGSSNGDSGSASGSSDGASGGSPSGAYITEVVDQFTTYCPSPTTITYGPSQTYVVTEAGSITITDCPCTITKPVYGGGAVPTDGADGGSPPYYGGGGGDGSDNGNGGDGGDNGDGGDGDPTDPNDGGDPTDPNDGGDGDPTDDTSSTTTGSTATASSTTDTALSTTDTASSTTETASSTTETASSTTETASSTTGIASSTTGIGIASSTTGAATGTTTSTSATSTPTDCVQAGGTCSGLLGSNGLLLSDDCCDGSSCFATLDINARSLKGGSLLRRQTLLGTCSGGNPDDGTCNAAGDACDATGALGLDPCCAGSTCTTLGLTLNGLAVVVDQCVANEPVTGPFNCATDETEQCCTASAANALQLLCTAPSSTDISSCGTQPAYCCPNDGVLSILNGVVYTGCQAAPGDGEDGGDSNGANGDVTFTCTNGEARCCTDADGLGLNLLCTGLEGDGTCSANQTPSCCDGDQTLGAVLALNCAAPATTTPVEGGGGNSPTTFACAANYDPTCCPASAITGGLGVGAVCQDPTNSACANTLFAEPLCCPTGGLLDPLLASQCFAPGSEPGVIATSFGCTGADTRQCCPAGTVSELGALCTEATTDDTATCSSLLGGSSAFCCSNTVLGIGGLLSTGCDPAGIVV